ALVNTRDLIPHEWLVAASLVPILSRAEELRKDSDRHHALVEHLTSDLGASWRQLGPSSAEELEAPVASLANLSPPMIDVAALKVEAVESRSAFLSEINSRFDPLPRFVEALALEFGIEPRGVRLDGASKLAELGALASSRNRPEASWLD